MFFRSVAVRDPKYVMRVGLIGRFAYVQSPSASSIVAETGSCFSLEGPGCCSEKFFEERERLVHVSAPKAP
jgi:hypothetical protein